MLKHVGRLDLGGMVVSVTVVCSDLSHERCQATYYSRQTRIKQPNVYRQVCGRFEQRSLRVGFRPADFVRLSDEVCTS